MWGRGSLIGQAKLYPLIKLPPYNNLFHWKRSKMLYFLWPPIKHQGWMVFLWHSFKSVGMLLQHDILELLREFHSNGKIPWNLNATFIKLISKKTNAATIQDFRPISLISAPTR